MQYIQHVPSPLGDILLSCDEAGLTGLWFCGAKYFAAGLTQTAEQNHAILDETRRWLDIYFSGREPGFLPPLHMTGSPFCMDVWNLLLEIPYGQITTYGELAKKLAAKRGLAKMSARAVGSAVGHNRISLLVPCHRVVGANGSLTGYAGGVDKKAKLLALEGVSL